MRYKGTILYSFIPSLVLAASMGVGSLHIATISAGSVIKGSGPALYYLSTNGKRYVFPNDKAYFSWYPDFSEVQTVSDSTLASYPLGGNVTYRPGNELVKIQSDPKVYAIDKGGVLRWVNSESAATAIFGSDWSQHVDDIADAFFINYTIGDPIYSASDYNPATEASIDNSIDTDLSLKGDQTPASTNTPAATTGGAGTVSISLAPYSSILSSGQSTTVTASGSDTSGITNIVIYANTNGTLVKTCTISGYPANAVCPLTIASNDYTNGSSISIYAQMTDRNGNTATSTTTTLTVQNNVTNTSGSVSLALSPYASTLASGQSTTVTASAYDAGGISSMGIYVNGSLSQTCPVSNYPTSNTCTMTLYGGNYANGSTVSVYGQMTDEYGNTATSTTSSISIQSSTATGTGSVSLSLSPYSTTLANGQTTTLTANGYDPSGIASMEIYVNGSLVQNCPVVSNYPTNNSCTMTLYGSNYANGSTVTMYAQLTNRYGSVSNSTTSSISIQSSTATGTGSVSLSLSPYASTLANGQSTTVTANGYDTNGIASMGIYVNGSLVQTCPVSNYPSSNTCTLTLYGGSYANGSTVSVYGQLTDRYGSVSNSTTSSLSIQSSTATGTGSVSLSLSPYVSTLANGQSTTVTANGYDTNGIASMSIYVNNSLVQTCPVSNYPTSNTCTMTLYGSNYTNGMTVSVYAQLTDRYGSVSNSTTSSLSIQSSTSSGNTGTNSGTISLSLTPSSTTLTSGQSTTANASGYDGSGMTNISVYVNGTLAQACPYSTFTASANCTATINSSNYANGATVSVYAQMTDTYGNVATSTTSTLTVQNTSTSGSGAGSVSLSFSPYTTTLPNNQYTTITANASDNNGIASMNIYVNGSLVGSSCSLSNYPTSGVCAVSLYGGNYTNGSTVSIYAQETNRNGTVSTSATSYLVI
jgi:maleate cis-trans isomerase